MIQETREQYRARLARELKELRAQGWKAVSREEIERLWIKLKAGGHWFNGCTFWGLRQQYGEDVMHLAGWGWLKQTRKRLGAVQKLRCECGGEIVCANCNKPACDCTEYDLEQNDSYRRCKECGKAAV